MHWVHLEFIPLTLVPKQYVGGVQNIWMVGYDEDFVYF